MNRILKDRHFWAVVLLLIVSLVLAYWAQPFFLASTPPLDTPEINLLFETAVNFSLVLVVFLASWYFGIQGGLALVFAIGILLMPHLFLEFFTAFKAGHILLYVFGLIVGVMVSWLVSNYKNTLEELVKGLKRERTLVQEWEKTFDAFTDVVCVISPTHEILLVNKTFYQAFGKKREEIIGKKCYELVHGTNSPIPECPCAEALISGKPTNNEYVSADGKVVLLTAFPIKNDDGKIISFTHLVSDITERKQSEQKQKELLDRLKVKANEWQDTVDAVNDFVCLLSTEHEFIRVNKAIAQSLGVSPEEIIGKKCYKLIHGLEHPIDGCPCEATLKTGKSESGEFVDRGKTFTATSGPILDEKGNIVALSHTVKDISERKSAELKLIAQDRLASVGELVTGVAHEINNPLTSVVGFSELLLQQDLPTNVKDDLEIIRKEAQRTSVIVKNLLTFARRMPEEKIAHDVNQHIREVLAVRRHVLHLENINVVEEFSDNLPLIYGNGPQLQQVFLNLIVNAQQAMFQAHKQGTLTIKTEQVDEKVRICVADDGPGIKPENMSRIFSPFFTTKEVGKGTGLGLSICQGIISEHGGKIWTESEYGKGASFIIELPIPQE